MTWDKKFECMPVEEIRKLQLKKLKETVAWVAKKFLFIKKSSRNPASTPPTSKTLEDAAKLPVTIKEDLRDNYPFGLCAVPMKDVVRVHASSGTTENLSPAPTPRTIWINGPNAWPAIFGQPVSAGRYCPKCLWTWPFYRRPRISPGLLQHGVYHGPHQCRADRKADHPDARLRCQHSLLHALLCADHRRTCRRVESRIKALPVRAGIFGAEPWTSQMRDEIEARMGIKAMEAYGLTELGGPGVAFDCKEQNGLHINEDHYLAEIVDPATLEPLPLGEKGELIFTSLQRRAMPMIRYRTKDITRLKREKCSCGRTFLKMEKVFGRTDDMLIISGVNVFPSQIESLLLDIDEVEPQYRLIVRKKGTWTNWSSRSKPRVKCTKQARKSRAKSKGKLWAISRATWVSVSRSTWWNPSSSPAAKARPCVLWTNDPSN